MRKIAMILVAIVAAGTIYAADNNMAERKQEAEKLLVVMGVPQGMTQSISAASRMLAARMQRMGMSAEQMKKSQMAQKEIMDLIKKEMAWDKIKGSLVSAYAETFTLEELKGIIKFYNTPVGKKFIEKQPELQNRVYYVQGTIMSGLQPKIKAIVEKYK